MIFLSTIASFFVAALLAVSWIFGILIPLALGALLALVVPIWLFLFSARVALVSVEKPFRVLLIDDQPSSLIVIQSIFESLGISQTVVTSGMDAIREMNRKIYDLVIIDHDLPLMSGPEIVLYAERFRCRSGRMECLAKYSFVPIAGYSTAPEKSWALPELKRFQVRCSMSKGDSYSSLRDQVLKLLDA